MSKATVVGLLLGLQVARERGVQLLADVAIAASLCWAVVEWRAGWPRRGAA